MRYCVGAIDLKHGAEISWDFFYGRLRLFLLCHFQFLAGCHSIVISDLPNLGFPTEYEEKQVHCQHRRTEKGNPQGLIFCLVLKRTERCTISIFRCVLRLHFALHATVCRAISFTQAPCIFPRLENELLHHAIRLGPQVKRVSSELPFLFCFVVTNKKKPT